MQMDDMLYCPRCGGDMLPTERFCGDCGLDTRKQDASDETPDEKQSAIIADHNIDPEQSEPIAREAADIEETEQEITDPDFEPLTELYRAPVEENKSSQKALIILLIILVLLGLGGGAYYWWNTHNGNSTIPSSEISGQVNPTENVDVESATKTVDLSQAAAYLPKAGLQCTFYENHQDGNAGETQRYTAKVVPAEEVCISDVEITMNHDQEYGSGKHYVQRADGIYLIHDSVPMEISPMLKNNMTIGSSWDYSNESGKIVWKVINMGVALDLGFIKLDNCLLLEEDNQIIGVKSLIYYAPGLGKVMEKDSKGKIELLKLTAFSKIDQTQAAEKVKRWSTNYRIIKDDQQ